MLLRNVLGETLREIRSAEGRTLREVSSAARVSLGYLSEIERGHKEASSEVVFSIAQALDVSLSDLMITISTKLAALESARQTRLVSAA